jgi:hypothetical protein
MSRQATLAAIVALKSRACPTLAVSRTSRIVFGDPRKEVPVMRIDPTRRDVLRRGGLAAVSAVLGPRALATVQGAQWRKIPVGTQLWCVRKQLATDIPGTLKALAEIGYEGVELENAFGKPGPEWRKHLDAAKLKPCGFQPATRRRSRAACSWWT